MKVAILKVVPLALSVINLGEKVLTKDFPSISKLVAFLKVQIHLHLQLTVSYLDSGRFGLADVKPFAMSMALLEALPGLLGGIIKDVSKTMGNEVIEVGGQKLPISVVIGQAEVLLKNALPEVLEGYTLSQYGEQIQEALDDDEGFEEAMVGARMLEAMLHQLMAQLELSGSLNDVLANLDKLMVETVDEDDLEADRFMRDKLPGILSDIEQGAIH
jgi:hypothetical protein